MMMRQAIVPMLAVLLSSSPLYAAESSASGQEVATNETLNALFGKAHNVMKDQCARLEAILSGFLVADDDLIRRNTDAIVRDMGRVAQTYPPKEGWEDKVWKAMGGIVENGKALRAALDQQEYQAAYQSFSAMIGHCIQCHQSQRAWGMFSGQPPRASTDKGKL